MAAKTYSKVQNAAILVEEYRKDSGKLPEAKADWEAIREQGLFLTGGQTDPFRDKWNRELVFRASGLHRLIDVYSVGEDGIDDRGEKDDISGWGGVNEGYYWKKLWPLGRWIVIGSCVVGIAVFCAGKRFAKHTGKPLAGLIISLGVALGSFCLLHPGVVPSRNVPLWIVIAISSILSLGFLVRGLGNVRYSKA